MISNKCKYALRAILHLAVESSHNHKKSLKDLSGELKIPTPYLGKILQELVPKNIISSVKGPNGGFYLTEENRQSPLLNIIEAIDGLSFFTTCGLGLTACSDDHPCPIHQDFKMARNHLKNLFTQKSVQDLATEIEVNDLFLVIN